LSKKLSGHLFSVRTLSLFLVLAAAVPTLTDNINRGFAAVPAPVEELELEKDELKFGFIKLTDCAPIVIAKEKGFFEAEGLQVEVTAQPNWKQLLDRSQRRSASALRHTL